MVLLQYGSRLYNGRPRFTKCFWTGELSVHRNYGRWFLDRVNIVSGLYSIQNREHQTSKTRFYRETKHCQDHQTSRK